MKKNLINIDEYDEVKEDHEFDFCSCINDDYFLYIGKRLYDLNLSIVFYDNESVKEMITTFNDDDNVDQKVKEMSIKMYIYCTSRFFNPKSVVMVYVYFNEHILYKSMKISGKSLPRHFKKALSHIVQIQLIRHNYNLNKVKILRTFHKKTFQKVLIELKETAWHPKRLRWCLDHEQLKRYYCDEEK